MLKLISILLMLISTFSSYSADSSNKYVKQFNLLVTVYQKCSSTNTSSEFYNCIKQKLVTTLDNVAKNKGDIKLAYDYLVLVRDDQLYGNISEGNGFEGDNLRDVTEPPNGTHHKEVKMDGVPNLDINATNKQVTEQLAGGNITGDGSGMKHHGSRQEKELHVNTNKDHSNDVNQTSSNLNQLLKESIQKITRNRSLMIKLPLTQLQMLDTLGDNILEGRKKKDNGMFLVACLMMGGTVLSLAFGSVAVLAGKALMTSMIALMLSLVNSMSKKGHSSGYTQGTTYEVVHVPSATGRDYNRKRSVTAVVQHAGWEVLSLK